MTSTSVQEQIIREAPQVEGYKLGLLQAANQLIQRSVPIPAMQVAGLTPQQQRGLSLAESGVGSFSPFITGASNLFTSAGSAYRDLPGYAQRAQAEAQSAEDLALQRYGTLQGYAQQGMAASDEARRLAQAQYAGLGEIGQAGAAAAGQYGATAAGLGMAGAQAYDPRSVSAYMNPYQEEVTRNALAEMNRQAQIQQQGLSAQAVKAGAFGGSREGVQRAELGRNLAEVQSKRILEDYFANYSQAQQAAMNAFANQQSRAQSAGNLALGAGQLGLQGTQQAGGLQQAEAAGIANLGQLGMQSATAAGQLQATAGQGIASLGQLGVNAAIQGGQLEQAEAAGLGALGQQTAALGQLQSGLQQGDVSFLYNIGTQQQQQRQRELDAQRQTQLQAAYEPYQRLGFLSDIYKGAPSSQMTISQTTAPAPSLVSQVAGLGTTALAAYNLAK
jgi:hypothetical protein